MCCKNKNYLEKSAKVVLPSAIIVFNWNLKINRKIKYNYMKKREKESTFHFHEEAQERQKIVQNGEKRIVFIAQNTLWAKEN